METAAGVAPGADTRRTCRNQKAAVQGPKEITELKDAIQAMHGCESLHVESVAVKEVFEGQTVRESKVEVFDLVGHRQAKRAYAWSYRDGNQNKTFAVLEISSQHNLAVIARAENTDIQSFEYPIMSMNKQCAISS